MSIVISIELLIVIFLLYKGLPTERKRELKKLVEKSEDKVIEWEPPREETEEAFQKVVKSL